MGIKEFLIASVFFIAVTLIFFHKIFLGLVPLPTDLIVGSYYPWINYSWGYDAGVPVKNPKLSDAVSIFYPLKSLAADYAKSGQLPLWNPYMFGGYPLFASVQLGLLFPTVIFYLLLSTPDAWTLQVMSQPFFAALFMYLLLRHLKLDKLPSVFGALAYGFGGFTILWMQWNTMAATSLFLPILILALDNYLKTKQLKWGVLLSIFLCLQVLGGYLPIIPFTLISLGLWYLFRCQNFFSDLRIIFFFILGLSLSAVFSLPVAELIQISQRTIENLGSGAFFPPENFINLIAPDFFGNDATGNFWGRGDHMDFTIYAGVTTLILALSGFKEIWKKTEIKFILCLLVLTVLISTENPLGTFFYKLGIWGGQSITMNRANFLINFSLSILGAYGFSLIKNSGFKLSLKPGVMVFSASLLLIAGLFLSSKYLFMNSEILLNHINISLRNLVLPELLIAVSILLILISKKINLVNPVIVQAVFILLLIFELFRFGWKFNTFSSPKFLYPQTPISRYLEQFPNDRVVAQPDIFPANMWVPFKISSIEGYDGIYPLGMAKLLAVANSGKPDATPQTRWGILDNFDSKILDETNSRFLLVKKEDTPVIQDEKYIEVFADKKVAILENTKSFPRAYLTKQVIKASDEETLRLMLEKDFPINTISITDNFEYFNNSNEPLKGDLIYRQVANSHIRVKAVSNQDAYLVALDSFYPGWKAFIDGKQTQIHRTNFNFRGILLPEGNHVVDFKYEPDSLKIGAIISVASLLLILSLITGSYIKKRIKQH